MRVVVGEDDFDPLPGVVGGSIPPFTSAEVLPPVEEATLEDFACRLRGAMAVLVLVP